MCWYRLKDANDPNAYRVVFGDLSVKDVAARDLPLPVGNKALAGLDSRICVKGRLRRGQQAGPYYCAVPRSLRRCER